jgi:hypothetical protein
MTQPNVRQWQMQVFPLWMAGGFDKATSYSYPPSIRPHYRPAHANLKMCHMEWSPSLVAWSGIYLKSISLCRWCGGVCDGNHSLEYWGKWPAFELISERTPSLDIGKWSCQLSWRYMATRASVPLRYLGLPLLIWSLRRVDFWHLKDTCARKPPPLNGSLSPRLGEYRFT